MIQASLRPVPLMIVLALLGSTGRPAIAHNSGSLISVLKSPNASVTKVQSLIAAGANVNARGDGGITPVMVAALNGELGCLKALIAAGADVNAKDGADGANALYAAAVAPPSDSDDVQVFLNHQCTALMAAANEGRTDCVKALIAANAVVDAQDNENATALFAAVEQGHLSCAQALVAAKASLSHRDLDRNTPLIIAASHGHPSCVKFLIAAGSDINAYAEVSGLSPISALVASADANSPDCLKALIAAGANVNALDGDALYSAADTGNLESVQALIAAGAKVNARTTIGGGLAIIAAAEKGRTACVKALISAGADVNARDGNGSTALSQAREGGYKDTVKILKAAGAVR